MPIDIPFFMPFLRRVVLPLVFLLLGVSVVLNSLLIMRTPTVVMPTDVSSSRASLTRSLQPLAFGSVVRPFEPANKFHPLAPLAAYSYAVSGSVLPALPTTMNVYRDQGIVLDSAVLDGMLQSIGMHISDQRQLLPVSAEFETSDASSTVSVDINRREVIVLAKEQAPASTVVFPADVTDASLIEAATLFAEDVGIDVHVYGVPTVTFGTGSAPQSALPASFAEVRWPLKVGEYSVFDQYGKPAIGMKALFNVERGLRVQLTFRLLSPDVLASSAYPISSASSLLASVASGGLTPIRSTLAAPVFNIPYKNASLAYVLWEGDGVLPLYLLPAVLLEADIPLKCETACDPWHWVSYIPVVDPVHFSWAAPSTPLSSSGVVKVPVTGSGVIPEVSIP